MTVQYMIMYLALAAVRTYHELSETPKGALETALRAGCQTLTYGPMLCVLFIACRMRVEFLSDGKGQPQMWVQYCMYAVTFAVMASTLVVLTIPLITGKPMPLKEGSCDLEKPEAEEGEDGPSLVFIGLSFVRYAILAGLYGGLAGIIFGINTYLPPGETKLEDLPPPAPAVMCTMMISVLFFSVQLIIAACRTYTEATGKDFSRIVGVMNAATTTVEFGPMLCILFLSLRMRALQHDCQPQPWAQNAMYASTCALCATTLLAIIVPLALGGTMKINEKTREATFEVPDPTIGLILIAVRYICMLSFYGGSVVVMYAIVVFEASPGPTVPVSPTVQCVMNLTAQFFLVYLLMTIMLTVGEVSGGKYPLETYKLFAALESSKATLAFAPMLSILFVTTRMYALLITDKKGAPQGWVQDGMYMATWAIAISFMACLFTGLLMDDVKTDEDGNVINKFSSPAAGYGMVALRYFSMFLLYGGILTVIYGLFVMTPETANGRGSLPGVGQTPLGDSPPGPGALAKGFF